MSVEVRESGPSATRRAARAVGAIAKAHLELARREAERDASRFAGALVLLVLASLFAALAVIGVHVALVVGLHERRGFGWLSAVGCATGGDLALMLISVVAARGRLRAPLLRDTRNLVSKTVEALTKP